MTKLRISQHARLDQGALIPDFMPYTFRSEADKNNCRNYVIQIFNDKGVPLDLDFVPMWMAMNLDSPEHENRAVWEGFIQRLVGPRTSEAVVRARYPWGIWRGDQEGLIEGAPALWSGEVSEKTVVCSYHRYPMDERVSEMVDQITWNLSIAEQMGHEVFVGVANVAEIDEVSSVPSLPNEVYGRDGSILLAEWSLDPNMGLYEWQRRPDFSRIQSICNFMDSDTENLILNSIMLYIPDKATGVEIVRDQDRVSVNINPLEFLVPYGENMLTDVEKELMRKGE